MSERNRAEGWKHAKLSGHDNEARVKELLDTDSAYAQKFLMRIDCADKTLSSTSIGGLHEHNVESVSGRKTKSKTDLKLFFTDGSVVKISVKKSLGGQVYFVRAKNFIQTFETQFGKKIPEDVKKAINLFWAADSNASSIIEKYADRSNCFEYNMQIRHKSLNANTLKLYDEKLYDGLLKWFKDNVCKLTYLCFATGAVKNKEEWSDFIWYKNMLGENAVDEVFDIVDICKAASRKADEEVYFGAANGGTTIQLPFGFVQWHQRQLQFHHSYSKVSALLEENE
ncbi:MAG: hypothetical protein K2I75_05945 [Clostridiales bacterium]|nr:hypothetical protein [Clostridiales bacterium]